MILWSLLIIMIDLIFAVDFINPSLQLKMQHMSHCEGPLVDTDLGGCIKSIKTNLKIQVFTVKRVFTVYLSFYTCCFISDPFSGFYTTMVAGRAFF